MRSPGLLLLRRPFADLSTQVISHAHRFTFASASFLCYGPMRRRLLFPMRWGGKYPGADVGAATGRISRQWPEDRLFHEIGRGRGGLFYFRNQSDCSA